MCFCLSWVIFKSMRQAHTLMSEWLVGPNKVLIKKSHQQSGETEKMSTIIFTHSTINMLTLARWADRTNSLIPIFLEFLDWLRFSLCVCVLSCFEALGVNSCQSHLNYVILKLSWKQRHIGIFIQEFRGWNTENYDYESTLDHKSEFMIRITKPNYVSVKK